MSFLAGSNVCVCVRRISAALLYISKCDNELEFKSTVGGRLFCLQSVAPPTTHYHSPHSPSCRV